MQMQKNGRPDGLPFLADLREGKGYGLLAGFCGRGDRRGLGTVQHRMRASSGAHHEYGQCDRGEHKYDRRVGGNPGEYIRRGARAEGGLRTLAAEGASQVGRAALLQEDHKDQNNAYCDMHADYENQKNIHLESCFPGQSG